MDILNNTLVVLGVPIALIVTYVFAYNKGLRQSGHHCLPEKVIQVVQGSRYNPQLLEYVAIECKECKAEIQAEVTISHTFKAQEKNRPYAVSIRYEDVDAHMLTHQINTTDEKTDNEK